MWPWQQLALPSLRFAHPWALLALLAIQAIAAWRWKRSAPATLRYSDTRLVRDLPVSWRARTRWLPLALRLLTLALLVVAVARPQASREREVVKGKGVDIVLALDMSGSMAALDFAPENRIEAAKTVIESFIEKRHYDRIGLVVFAREAFSQCPPTFDYDVLRQLLAQVDLAPEMGLDDGTAIGMGLAQAVAMLQQSEAASKLVILLTDGVNNAGQIDPITAAQAAEALDIRVYTVGMGKPGMVPFPVNDSLFGKRTRTIPSEIDEETLQRIADTTGALFFRATDTDGLQRTYDEIDRMEKSKIEIEVFTRYRELCAWVLIPAFVLLIVEWVLRCTVYRTLP